MASRLSACDVVQLMEDDDYGSGEDDDGTFEGDGVESYLSQVFSELSIVEQWSKSTQEDREAIELEAMEFEETEVVDLEDRACTSSSNDKVAHDSGKLCMQSFYNLYKTDGLCLYRFGMCRSRHLLHGARS